MPAFVAEYRSPSIVWEQADHLSVTDIDLQQMKTSYVTVPVIVEAPDLETAKQAVEEQFPNMVRRVYPKKS